MPVGGVDLSLVRRRRERVAGWGCGSLVDELVARENCQFVTGGLAEQALSGACDQLMAKNSCQAVLMRHIRRVMADMSR